MFTARTSGNPGGRQRSEYYILFAILAYYVASLRIIDYWGIRSSFGDCVTTLIPEYGMCEHIAQASTCLHCVYVYRLIPANVSQWPNVDLMLGHRLRRWPNMESTLDVYISVITADEH